MQRPEKRPRELNRAQIPAPPGADLSALAANATYVPSPYHKDYYTAATGPRKWRSSDATPCPRDVDAHTAEVWLRRAIAAGHVGAFWVAPDEYPGMAWYRHDETVFEARLSNPVLGHYHGYPLDPTEWPSWLP